MALKIKHWLACSVAFAAYCPQRALAQTSSTEAVTVTGGSRVISDAANFRPRRR